MAETPLPPGVSVQILATPQSVTVGDPIRLDIDIATPAGYKAGIPALDKQLGDFTILEFSPGPVVSGPGGKDARNSPQPGISAHHRARIVAAAYKTGTLIFPPVQIRLQATDGKEFTAASSPVRVEIQSVLSEKDRDLKDLKKQAEIPDRIRWGLWLAVLLAFAIFAAVALYFWKRHKRHVPTIPAAPPPQNLLDTAEAELRELLARGFPADSMVKPFYVRLSEIVKKILEAGYGIHTAERTTSEIMDNLKFDSDSTAEERESIESLLRRCDVVKFAKYVPSASEHDSAGRDAKQILKTCRDWVFRRQQLSADSAVETHTPVGKSERIQ